jgi:hypothetical protein
VSVESVGLWCRLRLPESEKSQVEIVFTRSEASLALPPRLASAMICAHAAAGVILPVTTAV